MSLDGDLRKNCCLPCSSSIPQMEFAHLAHLLSIYAFLLASWVTAGKAPVL